MSSEFKSLQEFYPFYLTQHQNKMNLLCHFIGSCLVILILLHALFTGHLWEIILAIIVGYGCAWVGHYFFEKDKPTTFKYPLYSFCADWMMFKDMVTGKIKFL